MAIKKGRDSANDSGTDTTLNNNLGFATPLFEDEHTQGEQPTKPASWLDAYAPN